MDDFRIPLGRWGEQVLSWMLDVFGGLFGLLRTIMLEANDALIWLLSTPPWWAIALAFAALAWWVRTWKLAVGTLLGFLLIFGMNQWDNAMATLSLVVVATLIAVIISVPLGILAASSRTFSTLIRPVLDFLQTMPPMVYLIPALAIFRVGVVPGMVATILFALAPGVRFTELGIRRVDHEVVEAGEAFGASRWRILRQIQLPLALPTIMAGINQVIMLALSMVVIAGMVGAGGLGGDVVAALNRLDLALGFEAGVSVVILAIFLDRLTSFAGKARTT
ncbi:MAG: ABC transporter permease subunit [Nesterenkonia sp.]|uniref:ABC transporter permease n=1 Tax=Nesterenkonia marinintestina TaxID=2979865 RepID=UPI0021BFB083|nr:ABC transporter permease subunit [Nesterenkonia sp. GX14115]MDO5492484.1 ABC transporter permease subunit [Nesterenkonia sp.]